MATVQVSREFTLTRSKYLAHGKAGSIYPSDTSFNFSDAIPSTATFVSATLDYSVVDSRNLFVKQYAYITDGDNPTSGSGYTYREAFTSAGLTAAINSKGLWYSSGFGVYLNYKNTSSQSDYSIQITIKATITYTTDEPDPEPEVAQGYNTGDGIIIQEGKLSPVNIALPYNKQWYDLQHGTFCYKYPELGIVKLQQDCAHSAEHFCYKLSRFTTTPLQGTDLTATVGTIDEQTYSEETGLYTVKSSSETLTINIKQKYQPNYTYYGCFECTVNTTKYNVSVVLPNGNTITNSSSHKTSYAANTYNTGYTFTFTNLTSAQQTYTFGVLFISMAYHSVIGATAPETFSTKLNNATFRQYCRTKAAVGLFNKVNGELYNNGTGWTASNFTKTITNQMAQLAFPATSANCRYYASTSVVANQIYLIWFDVYSTQTISGETYSAGLILDNTLVKQFDVKSEWTRVAVVLQPTTSSTMLVCPYGTKNGSPTSGSVLIKNINMLDITDTGLTSYNDFMNQYGDCQFVYNTRV